jgi:capsule biosynthesis phosphatase
MKRIVFDLDNTLCVTHNRDYANAVPRHDVIGRLRTLKNEGFEIVIATSRNVNTHAGNLGKINAHTLPVILDWLKRHEIPFDEIYVGKPWCGDEGFYVDDRAVRPSELLQHSLQEIHTLLAKEAP